VWLRSLAISYFYMEEVLYFRLLSYNIINRKIWKDRIVKSITIKYSKDILCIMVKLQEVNGRFFLSMPKDLVKWKKWIKGQELVIGFNERGNLEISEVK